MTISFRSATKHERASTLLLLLVTAGSVCAQTPSSSLKQRWDAVGSAAYLDKDKFAPYDLKVEFQVFDLEGKNPQTGTLERWASPEHTSTTISSPLWNEPQTGDDKQPKNRASYLIDELISAMTGPVSVPAYLPKGVSIREADRKLGSTTLHCLTVDDANPPALICTEPGSGVVLLDVRDDATTVRMQIGKFRGVTIPTELSISFGGRQAITGKVVSLRALDPADSHLAGADAAPSVLRDVEPGQTPRGGVTPGRKIAGNPPLYPVRARESHVAGTVVIGGIIDPSGVLRTPVVIASPDADLAQAAVDAVKTWRYVPYLLNGKPVEVDTRITVNFALSP